MKHQYLLKDTNFIKYKGQFATILTLNKTMDLEENE